MLSKFPLLQSIQSHLPGKPVNSGELRWLRDLSGGDVNQAALIGDTENRWFLKYHENTTIDMFDAEALALQEMASLDCIRVPEVVALGESRNVCWLLLEYIELRPSGRESLLGEQLAAMHAKDRGQFGWNRDNFIGSTPQHNRLSDDWLQFWRDQRIRPQLEMAATHGFEGRLQERGEELLACMEHFLAGHKPTASFLHGDLWAGNKAYTADGQPVIYDPASYYGDREADLAMTELFGGFGADFYDAYRAHLPIDDGYNLRRDFYNLYHVLNHLNLFGRTYLSRAENMIASLLAEVR